MSSIFNTSGYDCPQYVHFLDVSKASSGSYFDANQSIHDVSLKETELNVMSKSTNSELNSEASEHYPDSLIDLNEENKENQGTLICSEDEFKNSSYFEEIQNSPYPFRTTPARMKRRTGLFSSSKKNKSLGVNIGTSTDVNRNLFDSNRISTPYKESQEVANHEHQLDISAISNDVEIQSQSSDSQLSSVQENLDIKEVETRTTRSSSRLNKSAESASFGVSEVKNLTQNPDMFPVQRPSSDELLVKKTSSVPEINSQGAKKAKPITVVKPFNFVEGKKRKREYFEEYVPLAEQVANFHKKTPQRFRTTAGNDFKTIKHWSPHLVRPQSPNLQAHKRARGKTVLSQKELEDKEVQDMKQYHFRARPFDPERINIQNKIKNKRKSLTKPMGIKLHTSERSALHHNFKTDVETKYEFHALPVPRAILNQPVGIKEKKVIPATVPESPMFALKERSNKWKAVRKMKEDTPKPVFKFSARKPAKREAAFQIKHDLKITEIQPFSFDKRDQERYAKRDEKIKMEIEKSLSRTPFLAQPMPGPTPSKLPEVQKRDLTKPIPFSFALEQSCEKRQKIVEEEKVPQFKAQLPTVLWKPAFVPEKAITILPVEPFALHTDKRAEERSQLKEVQDARKAEQEEEALLRREVEAAEEKQQIVELRKQLVHKAMPIRQYKPAESVPPKKLTVPKSPQFATDERLRSRHLQ